MLCVKQMTAAHFMGPRCAIVSIAFCTFHVHILPKYTKLTTMLHQTIWENIRAVEELFLGQCDCVKNRGDTSINGQ